MNREDLPTLKISIIINIRQNTNSHATCWEIGWGANVGSGEKGKWGGAK